MLVFIDDLPTKEITQIHVISNNANNDSSSNNIYFICKQTIPTYSVLQLVQYSVPYKAEHRSEIPIESLSREDLHQAMRSARNDKHLGTVLMNSEVHIHIYMMIS